MPASYVARDGERWPLGTAADVAWIAQGTEIGTTITSAIPTVFDAYATVLLAGVDDDADQEGHDEAIVSVLRTHSPDQRWWLGYLETGADDIVFPDADKVRLYADWPYVLIQAGPEQARTWRRWNFGSFWSGHLPNLMFPADHAWLVSTLWDDAWTCVGGTTALIDDLLHHPMLGPRSRRVLPGADATPPGYHSF